MLFRKIHKTFEPQPQTHSDPPSTNYDEQEELHAYIAKPLHVELHVFYAKGALWPAVLLAPYMPRFAVSGRLKPVYVLMDWLTSYSHALEGIAESAERKLELYVHCCVPDKKSYSFPHLGQSCHSQPDTAAAVPLTAATEVTTEAGLAVLAHRGLPRPRFGVGRRWESNPGPFGPMPSCITNWGPHYPFESLITLHWTRFTKMRAIAQMQHVYPYRMMGTLCNCQSPNNQ